MGKAKRFNTYDETVKASRENSKGFGQARQNLSGIGSTFRSSPLPPTITTKTNSSQGVATPNEFRDDLFRIFDDIDPSRKLAFQTGGIGAGIVRTWTAQNGSGTVALLDSGLNQVFSNPIDMNVNKIIELDDPINDLDAVNLRTLNRKIQELVSTFHNEIRVNAGISESVILPEPNVKRLSSLVISESVSITVLDP